jgi:hypothetical protein
MKKPPRLDLNPSSADRWTTCTASPAFIRDNADKIPADSSTKFSQEGTTAHEVASALLESRPPRVKDSYFCPTPINAEMRSHAWNYMEYVEGLRAKNGLLMVEQKMELWYMPGRNAIVDAAVSNPDSLHVIDYKYGEGVVVSTEGNLQTAIYGKSIGHGLQLPTGFPVFIHIYQPRGRNAEDSPSHTWETTWGEIEKIARKIGEKATLIQLGVKSTLQFAPSEKACRWCPAKGFCEARRQSLTGDIEALAVIEDKTSPSLTAANVMSVEQIGAVLQHKEEIGKWMKEVEEYALGFVQQGGKIPGQKLVMSRGGNRYWSDPRLAENLLLETTILNRREVIEEKVISPAAAEKLLGKNKFSVELTNLITKPPGQPGLAPLDDKREEIGSVLDEISVQ